MDKDEFRKRLAEVAEFEEITPRVLREEEKETDHGHQVMFDGEEIEIDRESNPTLGIHLTKLKPKLAVCEMGCGATIPNQTIHKIHYAFPESHWRTKCATCGRYEHPSGEGLIDGLGSVIANTFGVYFRKKLKQQHAEEGEAKVMHSRPRK